MNTDCADATSRAADHVDHARHFVGLAARNGNVPGISVAVATPDQVLFAHAAGYADLHERREATVRDQYPWFSMTKIATATTAVRLHADDLLDLDAPIGSYLAGYRPDQRRGHPTTRQLLTHTAGLANPVPLRWVRPEGQPEDPQLLGKILGRHAAPRKVVGGRAAYSNIGYLLAGEVISAVTGSSVQESLRAAVLEPLGMGATGFGYRDGEPRSTGYDRLPTVAVPVLRRVLPEGIVGRRVGRRTALRPFLVSGAAYGGLVGTPSEAARLAAAHAAAPTDEHPILDQGDIEMMRTPNAPGKQFDHGIGWFRKPADAGRTPAFVEHYGTGGGFWNAMRIYPGSRLALVAMANTTSAWDFDRLFTQLEELSWT